MNKHVIAGKDRKPEETVQRIQKTLNSEGYFPEILSERINGGLFSILLGDKRANRFMANGKGISQELALASAYGEFMERFMTRFYFYDLWLTRDTSPSWLYDTHEIWTSEPETYLRFMKRFYPESILRRKYCYDINQSPKGDSYCFLPFKTVRDESCLIPVTFWRELYTSNGLAYGNNLFEARVQALCEIIERHVKYRVIGEGLSLPEIPEDERKNPNLIHKTENLLENYGLKCRILDASLGKKYPVTVLLIYTPDQQEAFLSFGAHPDKEIAIERSITEAFQGRNLESDGPDFLNMVSGEKNFTGLPENLESHFINSTGILHANIFKPVSPDRNTFQSFYGTSEEEWDYLCGLMESSDYTILIRDVLWKEHTACQIIIPGYSEVYPYSDVLQKDFKGYCEARDEVLSLLEKDSHDTERLIELLDSEHFEQDQGAGDCLGVLFPPDSPWSRYSIRELIEMFDN